MSRGIWLSDTHFHAFADDERRGLADHIATRARSGDFGAFFGLLPNPDPVLKRMGKDMAAYRELAADAHVKGCMRRRRGALKALERGFDKAGTEGRPAVPARVMKAVEAIFRDLPIEEFIGQSVDGSFYGYAPFELLWQRVGAFLVPGEIDAKPPEWFGFDDDNRLRFRSRTHQLTGEELPERKFLLVRSGATYLNPYGEPDLASVFWPTTFKRGGLKFWVTFTEKYGTPWAVGKLPRTASPADHAEMVKRLDGMIQDAVASIPDDGSVELLTVASATNAELYERLLLFCRSEVSIALLGNNQSTEASANRASAVAAQDVEADLRDADAGVAAAALTRLARWIVDVNWGRETPSPVYSLWEQEEVDDALAKRDETLSRAGANFTRRYFIDAYNLEEEHLDEEAEPAGAPAAPGTSVVPGAEGPAFAEGDLDDVAPDQAALDAAIERLPAEALNQAMRTLLAPALDAIRAAESYDQVRQALVDAYPQMDAAELEELMRRAFFVADLWGAGTARQP